MDRKQTVYGFEDFQLNVYKRRLMREDQVVQLPPKAMDLLILLVENQGVILDKEDIIDLLWSENIVEEANLTQTIYLLRKALGKTSGGDSFIETLPRRGYKFIPSVREISIPNSIVKNTNSKQEKISIEKREKEIRERNIAESEFAGVFGETILPNLENNKSKFSQNKLLGIAIFMSFTMGLVILFFSLNGNAEGEIKHIKSIAVIPFNVIGEKDQESYLSLGLADTLTTRLASTKKIKVFPTEKVKRYSKSLKEPINVGKRLKADTILTGNLQQFDKRVRFNAQLIRVSDGFILWSNQFDEKSDDLFILQDSLTRRVTKALTLELTEEEQEHVSNNPTDNPEALKLYWQGRYYWNKRTRQMIQKGIENFKKAVKLDPDFAEAYAGLADSYALTASGLPPQERFPKAKAAAYKALELNENLPEVHTSLAIVTYKSEWNWAKAEKHFKRAIEIDESYPTAHHWYGELLVMLGRFGDGFKELKRAEQLDPFSIAIKTDIGEALYRARRYDEAKEQIKRVLEFDPDHIQAHRILRHIYQQISPENPDVVKTDLQILSLYKVSPEEIVKFRNQYESEGWAGYWEKRLKTLPDSPTNRYSTEKIVILILLKRYEQAIVEIEKKSKKMQITPIYLTIDPIFTPLNSYPKFSSLIK